MRHNEQNYSRGNQGRHNPSQNLSDHLMRYEDSGNYYGREDQGHQNRQGRSGYDQSARHTQGQMHQNEWGGGQYGDRSQANHYHYGDPNPYMGNQRNQGYERDRGTGWSESDVDHSNRRYSRQDNSYQSSGQGRRFDQYGQDERYNYAHGQQDGRRSIQDRENLDDRYYDRGEHARSSSENDYGQQFGANYDHRNRDRQGRDDDYESGRYRASGSQRSHDRDQFDHTSDDYPSRSPKGYGHPSGPDYSASSPITNYGSSVRGYQK